MPNLKSLGITWDKIGYNVDGEASIAFLIVELEMIADNIQILYKTHIIKEDAFSLMSRFIVDLMKWSTNLVQLDQNNNLTAMEVETVSIKNKITKYNSLKKIYNSSL